jgi:hypothetical protein
MFAWLQRFLPAIFLSLCLIAILDATLSSIATCHPEHSSAISEKSQECTALAGPILASVVAMVDFLDRHGEAVVGVFTIVLAGFTGALWRSTDKLWEAGERQLSHLTNTAQRELRAYVYVRETKFEYSTARGWKINYRIENFGQTPAHNVRLVSIAKIVEWNGGNPKIPSPNHVETVGSMAPSGDFFEFEEYVEGDATPEEIGTGNGTKAIFLVGNILYDTIFEADRRITNFRYYIGGDAGVAGDEMSAASEGNDAT